MEHLFWVLSVTAWRWPNLAFQRFPGRRSNTMGGDTTQQTSTRSRRASGQVGF